MIPLPRLNLVSQPGLVLTSTSALSTCDNRDGDIRLHLNPVGEEGWRWAQTLGDMHQQLGGFG
jgi:hypothetical protein